MAPESQQQAPQISIGSIVIFEQDGSSQLGVVTGHRKALVMVFSMRAREYEFKANRLHQIGLSVPSNVVSIADKQRYLSDLYENGVNEAAKVNISEIWELIKDEEQELTSSELAKYYLGDNLSPSIYLAFRLALTADRIFFKRHDESFSPRPPEVVEDLKRHEAVLAKKLADREMVLSKLLLKIKDSTVEIPDEASEIIRNLEEVAAGVTEIEHSALRETKEFLNSFEDRAKLKLPEHKEGKAQIVLERLGLMHKDSNLSVIRHRIPRSFSKEIRELSTVLNLPQDSKRRDLRELKMVTIDDVSTRDMDDALSIEQDGEGWSLGIHISDVASYVEHGSDLDREVRRRGTSLYLAGEVINMFPRTLSDDLFSLKEDQDRAAVSIVISLDRNFAVKNFEVFPSLVRVSQKMNYDQVDELLAKQDPWLGRLQQAAASYESYRLINGANKVSKKEAILGPVVDGKIKVQIIDEDAPSRLIVSEMMICANEALATFAAKNKIPLLFRGQPEPEEEISSEDLPPEGPAREFFLRSRLQKSMVSPHPARHFALGLDAYCQATSPIRRYLDIINQRQILAFIRGQSSLLSEQELETISADVDPRLSTAQLVSRETRRYWMTRYIEEQTKDGSILTGTVVRRDGRFPIIELDNIYATVIARLRPETLNGARVGLKVLAVNARREILKLEECSLP